ncbi:hypothetical protein HZZ00_19995 [Streptomyces sp. NEAU-sy36]|uniref:hypothetical protein n=1 Tax=unclassified Streptomyces TaxID=2593676 RepID=UPI0015D63C3E|nr:MULTISPECIES: hypothetical protein [unclassified Streptomyces]QLJ03041.1 hypothetical protein HZZ00_19995 [Streptomyces sp. NEAU-sy36]
MADEKTKDLLRTAVQAHPPNPVAAQAGVREGLGWWRSKAAESLFVMSRTTPGSWVAGEDALRLSEFIDGRYDDSDSVEALRDAVMDQFPPHGGEGLFTAVARKASPFSALAYALGPDAVLRLPGWFGDFLLDAEQVRARLPAAEEALTLTGARRQHAAERIRAWLTGLGDAPDQDVDELIDGPLRVLRHAARTGQGAAGQVRWY